MSESQEEQGCPCGGPPCQTPAGHGCGLRAIDPAPPKVGDIWWRCDARRYAAPLNEYDEPEGPGSLEVRMEAWTVIKITPKGVKVGLHALAKEGTFILATATKQFAHATKAAAIDAMIARKTRYLRILKARALEAQQAIDLVTEHRAKLEAEETGERPISARRRSTTETITL